MFKLNRMEYLKISEKTFERRQVPMPDLSNEKIFSGGIKVKALFEPECKWRLVEEFGIQSFRVQQDGKLLFQADYTDKENLITWLPDFVTKEDFDWAIEEAAKKKKEDYSKAEFLTYDEGLCVQCMHIGSYDDEPVTVGMMHDFMTAEGYELDIIDQRFHHEIYLSDARRTAPEKLKTVIRHPVKRIL